MLAAADSGALAEYVALIAQKVERNWVRPPSAKAGLECELSVTQIPGGQVTDVRIGNCPADDAVRRSIEAACASGFRSSIPPRPGCASYSDTAFAAPLLAPPARPAATRRPARL